MAVRALKGAPQLTRLIRNLPQKHLLRVLHALARHSENLPHTVVDQDSAREDVRRSLDRLHPDDLGSLEKEAQRITRLDHRQADALHLRLADAPKFECRAELEEHPGALARAAWTYVERAVLFRQVERAMQMRSYREHRRIHEAYELFAPVEFNLEAFDDEAFADALSDRLDLRGGCTVEAVEVPAEGRSQREIMIAVTSGGARESQRTFENDLSVGLVQYRPMTELILVYRPDLGRMEVCGRQWTDRRSIARYLASEVPGEDLSQRPLSQRNYDLGPFRTGLTIDVPEALSDRVQSIAVTEVRLALGTYDRKITVHALAGEDIDAIVRNVLNGLGSKHGQPFLCDVELLLAVNLPDRATKQLRFSISNQNRSTLQSETDPEKRAVGFEVLTALGVVSTSDGAEAALDGDMTESLLKLLGHAGDRVGAAELREMRIDVSRLTNAGFLTGRQIATTLLIDDEDIGPVEGEIEADLGRKRTSVELDDGVRIDERQIDEVLSWTINRGYAREVVLRSLKPMAIARIPEERGPGLFWLGDGLIDGANRPVFLFEGGNDLDAIDRADRVIRSSDVSTAGMVLTPTRLPLGFLGRFAVVYIGDLLDPETGKASPDRIHACWIAGSRRTSAASAIDFQDHGETAELIVPGLDPLTIVGPQRIRIFARLAEAAQQGMGPLKTQALLAETGYSNFQAAFKSDWKERILGTYVINVRRSLYRLADGKT